MQKSVKYAKKDKEKHKNILTDMISPTGLTVSPSSTSRQNDLEAALQHKSEEEEVEAPKLSLIVTIILLVAVTVVCHFLFFLISGSDDFPVRRGHRGIPC